MDFPGFQGPIPVLYMKKEKFPDTYIHEIIELALDDKVPFQTIYEYFGIDADKLKLIMQSSLKKKSYVNWRKRVKNKSRKNINYKLM